MKSTRRLFIMIIVAFCMFGVPATGLVGVQAPPQLEGAVTSVQYGETVTIYECDANGNPARIAGGAEDIIIRYAEDDEIIFLRPKFNPYEQIDSDYLGCPTSVVIYDPETGETEICVYLGYDALGGISSARVEYADDNSVARSFVGRIEGAEIFLDRIVYEREKAAARGVRFRVGYIRYSN